ncbi:Hypp7071 [Branchiostoma lanceolatum]|uniref:Hypp7071 protein n=1 Tax=Branchiostoma lanceolatum TaxID=7740 RepID=A0A8J9YX43_BRALA|nr:Hypp7071 [Branchiostoma lanceolatum]
MPCHSTQADTKHVLGPRTASHWSSVGVTGIPFQNERRARHHYPQLYQRPKKGLDCYPLHHSTHNDHSVLLQ